MLNLQDRSGPKEYKLTLDLIRQARREFVAGRDTRHDPISWVGLALNRYGLTIGSIWFISDDDPDLTRILAGDYPRKRKEQICRPNKFVFEDEKTLEEVEARGLVYHPITPILYHSTSIIPTLLAGKFDDS